MVVGNETGQVPIANSAWAAAENLYNFLFGYYIKKYIYIKGLMAFFKHIQLCRIMISILWVKALVQLLSILNSLIGGHYVPAISSLILSKKPSWLSFKGVGIGDG